MRIWLNELDGSSRQVELVEESTFETLLAELNLESCRLICQGSALTCENFKELLFENANVYANGDLEGGKKKKKKKVYTTKKKNKHIHKRVKLAIYTLYSVDGTLSSI